MGCMASSMASDRNDRIRWDASLTSATKRLDQIARELKAGDLPLTKEQHAELAKAAKILDDLTDKPWHAR